MTEDITIKKELDNGVGILSIAKKYNIGVSRVQKVKTQGRYYLDLLSGEIIFASKKISLEEQVFHYLSQDIALNTLYVEKDIFLKNRAVVPRITNFMIAYMNLGIHNRNSLETRFRGYYNKKTLKLVGCNENGDVDSYFLEVLIDFISGEQSTISKNYYLDEHGMPRGWGLWSLYISEQWETYLMIYIKCCLSNKFKTDAQLRKYMLKKWQDVALKNNIDDKTLKKHLKYNYINSLVALKLIRKFKGKVDLSIDRILWMDLRAYRKGLVSKEFTEIIKEHLTI